MEGVVDPDETTGEVQYLDIFNRTRCPWFMEGVAELQARDVEFPMTSHANSRKLTAVHREHPRLAFACAPALPVRASNQTHSCGWRAVRGNERADMA